MVSQITLGNVYQSNGKNVVGGTQSQLDTQSIIDALVAAKRQPATDLETKDTTIDSQISAYSTLQSLLSQFESAADSLRNPPGVGNASQNIFQYRTAALSSSTGVDASNYLSVSVEPGSAVQNYTINEIHQLATQTKLASNTFSLADTTSASAVNASGDHQAGQFSAGTFSLRVLDGGSDAQITLNEGDSLQTVVNKFNSVSGRTGIQANILKVASGSPDNTYQIVFTSTQTGETYDFDLTDPGTVTSDADGVLSTLSYTGTHAQNAQFTLDGVAVERDSNSISDLVDGMTFTLKQATPAATTLSASVQPDTDIVKNAITQFADAYNNFRLFASKQTQIGTDGLPTSDAVLANESELRNVISQVASEVTRAVDGITGGDPSLLADIGISFSNFAGDDTNPATKNIMTVDTDKLTAALTSNFDGVRGLFEFQMTSDNSNLAIYKRSNALGVTDFTLDVDPSGGTYTATYLDANNASHTVNLTATQTGSGTYTLSGQDGTVLEGLQLIYASGDTASINVHMSQGMGDRLYNLMDSIINTTDGSLTNTVSALQDQETRNKDTITKIDDQIATYRDQLTNQYAALESALTKANSLLALLDAQSQARNASNN